MIETSPSEVFPSQLNRRFAVRACWIKSGFVVQGRAGLRTAFTQPVVVTPWGEAANAPVGAAMLATGRDLSSAGLSFSHADPLPYRFAAVSLLIGTPGSDGEPVVETLLLRLLWCRFTRAGRYLSGGRFERSLGPLFGDALATLLSETGSRNADGPVTGRAAAFSSSGRAAPEPPADAC